MSADPHPTMPSFVYLRGIPFVALAARIISRDHYGRPEDIRLICDDVPVESAPGDQFCLVYIQESVVERKS